MANCEVAFRAQLPFTKQQWKLQFNGYLRYKTITSQSVSSKAQVKNFLYRRKVFFRSQDMQVFVFLTIPRSTKSVTSWWVLVHEKRCIFDYIF